MIDTAHYHGVLRPLIDWVQLKTDPGHSAQKRDDAPPDDLMTFVNEHMPEASHFHYWAADNTSKTAVSGEWLKGFPHKHTWPDGVVTMICYLTACEGGAIELGKDSRLEGAVPILPAPGLCLFLSPDVWHGVRPITQGHRQTIIVTGFP